MPVLKKAIKKLASLSLFFVLLYFVILLYPNPFFTNKITFKNCTVYSDRGINPKISFVINSALNKIKNSPLYDSNIHFTVFLCNDLWRFKFFTQGNKNAGGITHTHFTGNIFIRPSDIENNAIIPPGSWKFAKYPYSLNDRPLSYFIAHEMVHRLQMHYRGMFDFNTPKWLHEGYADYVAKAGNFNFESNLKLLKQADPQLDPKQGLYRYYHLLISYLLDKRKMAITEIYKHPPNAKKMRVEIINIP